MINLSPTKVIASVLLVCGLTACNGNSENKADNNQVKKQDASTTLNAPNAESAITISNNHFDKEKLARRKAIEVYDLANKLRAYEVTGYDEKDNAIGFLNVPVAKGFGLFTNGGERSRSERIAETHQKKWKPLLEKNGINILSNKMVGNEFGFLGMAVKTDKPLSEATTDAVKNYFAEFSSTAYKVDDKHYVLSFFPEAKTNFAGLK